jgi:glycosyltransferase involved in cell wall biosynthesis
MTINVYTFCWNEIYMLPHFFENYKWADKIVVYDNGSDDGTQEFVKSQPKGELRHFDTGNKYDEKTLIEIKDNCWKGDTSDWVVVCDSDEFLQGHEKLEKYIGQVCIFDCWTWEMVSEEVPTDFSKVTLKYHYPHWAYKCLCFSPKIKEINYRYGSHKCKPIPDNKIRGVLEYNHYSSLSEDYLVKKWQRAASRLSDENLKRGIGKNYLYREEKIRKFFRKQLSWAKEGRGL